MSVYFIQDGSTSLIKIGSSDAVVRRKREMECANPSPLTILAEIVGQGTMLERLIHIKFAKMRIRGEWFKADPALLRFIDDVKANDGLWRGELAEKETWKAVEPDTPIVYGDAVRLAVKEACVFMAVRSVDRNGNGASRRDRRLFAQFGEYQSLTSSQCGFALRLLKKYERKIPLDLVQRFGA